MRKKWGMILGLTGMMLLGSQSIYAAEAADDSQGAFYCKAFLSVL